MIIESLIIGSAVVGVHEAVTARRHKRREAQSRELWFHAIQSSQEITKQLSAARQAMVNEVRRQQRSALQGQPDAGGGSS